MPKRNIAHKSHKQYVYGDLNGQIRIHERAIKAPVFGSSSFTEVYDEGLLSFCRVTIFPAGKKIFDGVNLEDQPTHLFVIRYRDWITSEHVVKWNKSYYKSVKLIDPGERHEWWEIYANLRGSKDLEANT